MQVSPPYPDSLFQVAVKHVATPGGPEQTNNTKLVFYAAYKQATEGDNTREAPSFLNFVARSKHDAWAKLRGLTKQQAKDLYVSTLIEVDPRFKLPVVLAPSGKQPSASSSGATPLLPVQAVRPPTPASVAVKSAIPSIVLPSESASPPPTTTIINNNNQHRPESVPRKPSGLEAKINELFVDSGALRTSMINFVLIYNVRFMLALVVRLVTLGRTSPRTLLDLGEILSEKHMHFREEAVRMGLFVGSFSGIYLSMRKVLQQPDEDPAKVCLARPAR